MRETTSGTRHLANAPGGTGRRARGIAAALALAALLPGSAPAGTWAEIAPILQARCVMCHQGDAAPLGLRLDSLDGLRKGSKNGPVAKQGDVAGSELIRRLTGDKAPRMPMTGPPWLTDAEVELFRRFVAAGMPAGAAGAASAVATPKPKPRADGKVTWAEVAPILATRCAKCHTENGLMGPAPEGYRLTDYAAAIAAVDRVRVVPGVPAASELLRRIRGQSRPRMPFDGPPWLSEAEVKLIADWIAQGARDAEGKPAPMPTGARVRLGGLWADGERLDDLPLVIDGGTRVDKRPRVGGHAEVRGVVQSDGAIVATRIRRR